MMGFWCPSRFWVLRNIFIYSTLWRKTKNLILWLLLTITDMFTGFLGQLEKKASYKQWKLTIKLINKLYSTNCHKIKNPTLLWCRYMRQCLNELQKEYCVKTKIIALDWQWVTLRSWCQMNRNGHRSPVKHKVEGKPHKILEKLKITSGKSTLFGHFFVKQFQITCVHICIYPNTNDNTLILHTCLTLPWCCVCSTASYDDSALVLGRASKKNQ